MILRLPVTWQGTKLLVVTPLLVKATIVIITLLIPPTTAAGCHGSAVNPSSSSTSLLHSCWWHIATHLTTAAAAVLATIRKKKTTETSSKSSSWPRAISVKPTHTTCSMGKSSLKTAMQPATWLTQPGGVDTDEGDAGATQLTLADLRKQSSDFMRILVIPVLAGQGIIPVTSQCNPPHYSQSTSKQAQIDLYYWGFDRYARRKIGSTSHP